MGLDALEDQLAEFLFMGHELLLGAAELGTMKGLVAASMAGGLVLEDLMDVAVEIWRPDRCRLSNTLPASFPEVLQALVLEVLVLDLKEICLLEAIDFLVLEADVLGDYLVFERMLVLITKHALLAVLLGLSPLVANAG